MHPFVIGVLALAVCLFIALVIRMELTGDRHPHAVEHAPPDVDEVEPTADGIPG